MALRAHIPLSVYHLEYERCIYAPLAVIDLSPILAFPPSGIDAMELAIGFEEDVGRRPDFIVDASAGWMEWHRENQGVRN